MKHSFGRRVLRSWLPGVLLSALLAGCATAPGAPPRVISFGDSLSDLGTYALRTEGRTAGRFTTNPGPLWVEIVAQALGTTITPYRHAGWGKPAAVLGGTAYGEGGSRVALQPGSNNTDATTGQGTSQSTMPLRDQLDAHLAVTQGRFAASDWVFVWAGANDLFRHALFAPVANEEAGTVLVRAAARDLVVEVRRMIAAGARNVLVLNQYDWGEVPAFRAHPKRKTMSLWSRAFNEELAAGLQGQRVVPVDTHRLFHSVTADPGKEGLKNAVAPACRVADLPRRSVMFCTQETLIESGAHLTYLFADGVHPTTAGHRLIAREVLSAIKRADP